MKAGLEPFRTSKSNKSKIDDKNGVKGALSVMQINMSQIASGRRALIKTAPTSPSRSSTTGKRRTAVKLMGVGAAAAAYSPHTGWVSQRTL